ncbi:Fur family zinc uptake transcriptional regulator [Metabacillus sp. SLBN-84]
MRGGLGFLLELMRGADDLQEETYIKRIKQNGYKCTPQRLEILSYFLRQRNRLVSAKHLLLHLRNTFGKVSFDTIYRNLSLFSDIGLTDFTFKDGENFYYLKEDKQTHQNLFICKKCLTTKNLTMCPMDIIQDLEGYTIYHHRFEVYGICPSCL